MSDAPEEACALAPGPCMRPGASPMTPEALRAIRATYLDDRLFLYGNNWLGTAAWYKERYPGFTDEQCKVLEQYSSGVTPKMYRNLIKKQRKKCSASSLPPS
jgi:hypothetical protein